MKCPHCKSTEVIAIQGQNYCLSCGQQVADAQSLKSEPDTPTQSQKPAPTKSSSGLRVSTSTTQPKSLPAKAIQAPISPTSKPATTKPAPPAATFQPKANPKVATLNTNGYPNLPHAALDSPHPARSALNVIIHHLWLATFFTSGVAAIIILYASRDLWPEINSVGLKMGPPTGTGFTLRPLLLGMLVVLASSLILYLYHTSSRAKITYFSIRLLDNRQGTAQQLDQASMSAYWRLIRLDLLVAIILSLLIFLQFGLFKYANIIPNSGGLLRPFVLTLAEISLLYVFAGLFASRIFGSRAIVLAAQAPTAALSWGWRIFWHNSSDIVLWAIEWLTFSSLILLPLAFFVYTRQPLADFSSSWVIEVLLFSTICGYFLIVFSLAFWSAAYFGLCNQAQPRERQALLGTSLKLSSSNAPLTWALLTVMLIEATVYIGWSYQNQLADWLIPLLNTRL